MLYFLIWNAVSTRKSNKTPNRTQERLQVLCNVYTMATRFIGELLVSGFVKLASACKVCFCDV